MSNVKVKVALQAKLDKHNTCRNVTYTLRPFKVHDLKRRFGDSLYAFIKYA
jgi:hypothetical protein